MRLIRPADHRRMAWKNGLGETAEIAVGPDPGAPGDFAWRVSLARIGADGPFSAFPGVDRTLALLEGGPLRLRVGDGAPVTLEAGGPPLRFPGDLAAEAWLLGSPALALNVMTRRCTMAHQLTRTTLDSLAELGGDAPALLLCHAGAVRVSAGTEDVRLGPLDSLHLDTADSGWRLHAAASSVIYLARFRNRPVTAETGTSGRGPWSP